MPMDYLDRYQVEAFKSSRIDWETPKGRQVAILGVLGELGSLATVIKKRLRDGKIYTGAQMDLAEECGDVLWYVAAIASHYGIVLSESVAVSKQKGSIAGASAHLWSLIDSVLQLNSILAADDEFHAVNGENLQDPLGETVQMVLSAIEAEGLDINETLARNLLKTRGLFDEIQGPAPDYDSCYPAYERLPRDGKINFLQPDKGRGNEVLLRMNGLTIGDRLTDNSASPDGYRFHDAFHLAYVATLGWSPVFRALLKAKRKSNSSSDSQQDGARAIIIEEAITQQVFNHARDHNFYEGANKLDYDLLKWVRQMVRGLEVDDRSETEWQHAILIGYSAFRRLKDRSGGTLRIDCASRSLSFVNESDD